MAVQVIQKAVVGKRQATETRGRHVQSFGGTVTAFLVSCEENIHASPQLLLFIIVAYESNKRSDSNYLIEPSPKLQNFSCLLFQLG